MLKTTQKLLLAVMTIVALTLPCLAQSDYCNLGQEHTMCSFQQDGCTKADFISGISDSDKEEVLRRHNQLRSKLANGWQSDQPSASNMRELKWDDELQMIAQRWADQCTFQHDVNRKTANNEYVGQNLALTQNTNGDNQSPNFTEATDMWYDEVVNPGFDSNGISPYYFSSGVGHYTQLVWADTDRIGCGFSFYQEDGWYTKLYVCDYYKGGNIIGEAIYKVGTPASKCKEGESTDYPGLCAS